MTFFVAGCILREVGHFRKNTYDTLGERKQKMNVLFFLTPKSEITYVFQDYKISKVMEVLDGRGYTAVPMIDRMGRYVGTVTEGDILRLVKEKKDLTFDQIEEITIGNVPIKRDVKPVLGNADMVDLIKISLEQNFVPVVDDNNTFIGIITRRDIIHVCYAKAKKNF